MNKNNLHYIALLLLILLIAGISLANMQSVTVNFLLVQFKLPLIILILLCVLLGAFVMTLVLPKKRTQEHSKATGGRKERS